MSNFPKLSIVMPSLNVVDYISECIESVLNQSLKDIEIICVDAGSHDGTLEILQEYASKDKRIKLIISDKKSYGYQMNLGLDAACGKYFGIVETDDFVPDNMFEQLYTIAEENHVDFIKSDFYRFKVNKDFTLDLNYNRLSQNPQNYNRVLNPSENFDTFRFIMNTWSGIYNIDFLRKWKIRHNETPGASFQDTGFWFMTFCRAQRAYFLDKPLYMNRRDNPNSSVYDKSKVYCATDEFNYIRSCLEADPDNLSKFLPLCNYHRFCSYYYGNINRIAPEYQRKFIYHFSQEFKLLADNCELDQSMFSPSEWKALTQIIYAPEHYSLTNKISSRSLSNVQLTYLDDAIDKLPLISIIVPVYNMENYLDDCLDSILRQSLADFEIICIDDGSTDGSWTMLEYYAKRDSRVRLYRQNNLGVSSARNLGLSYAKGEYICFVDSDDGLAPNALNKIYQTATKNKADVVIFGFETSHYPLYGEVPAWLKLKNPVRNIVYHEFDPKVLFEEPGATPLTWRNCYRRSFLSENDLFYWPDCHLGEDTVFQMQAFPKARNITFIKDKLYYYRCTRPDSAMGTYNSNPVLKTRCHIEIVAYLSLVLDKNILDKIRTPFTKWAIDFVYGEWNGLIDHDKSMLAGDFLGVFNSFLNEGQKKMLGPKTQECIRNMEQYSTVVESLTSKSLVGIDEFFIHEACFAPKISFVVPVYNMDKYIGRCLKSLLNQTLEDIEVICVNDASTDNTAYILQAIAKRDKRLSVITYDENRTANQARKDAVLASRGEYILFCDADDSYCSDACKKLYTEMKRAQVDILHFGMNIINCGGSENDKKWLDTHMLPYFGALNGKNIIKECYLNNRFGYSLVNKMYSSSLAKRAFSKVENGRFPRGQDVYAFTLLAYYADTYRGVSGFRFYNYHLGLGMDGTHTISAEQFSNFCSFSRVTQALEDFFRKIDVWDEYNHIWQNIQSRMIGDCVNKWYNKVPESEKGVCYDLMLKAWPDWKIAESVARRYWYQQDKAIRLLSSSEIKNISKPVKVIGVYYHKLVGGGVEKVLEFLTPLFISMDYQVVLLTDIQGPNDFIQLPDGVKRYMIPNPGIDQPQCYYQRAKQISEIIHEESIDLMLYHAWNTSILAWDMLVSKSAKAAFIVNCHSVFSMRLLSSSAYFATKPKVFRFADGVICLSEVDKVFWGNFNNNVFNILNPSTFDIVKSTPSNLEEKNVLWIGRISSEKRPEDALRIFQQVFTQVPGARLIMLGTSESQEDMALLESLAKSLRIYEQVEFCGYIDDVSTYFKRASALLVTSEYEGFALNILESKTFGVPIVMYDLPYLTLTRGNRGILSVPYCDFGSAANYLINLLQDGNLRTHLGKEARNHALELAEYDYSGVWREILDSIALPLHPTNSDDEQIIMWDTLLDHYAYGLAHNKAIKTIAHTPNNNFDAKNRGVRVRFASKIRCFFQSIKKNGIRYTYWQIKKLGINSIRYYKKYGMRSTVRLIRERLS